MESKTFDDELLAVTYSEFDNAVGPQLLYEYPTGKISPDVFEAVSEYVILGKHLCEKIIIINIESMQFLNISVAIENSKYERNTLSFAIGLVLAKFAFTDPYERVLRKLCSTLISMEMEEEFLFRYISKCRLGTELLRNIYNGLRNAGEVFVEFDDANLLSARLLQPPQYPRLIQAYDVPVLIQSEAKLQSIPWDITVTRILNKINGKLPIHRIAHEIDADIECVCKSIRTLLFYNCVAITDIFLFSNIYETTDQVLDLHRSLSQLMDSSSKSQVASPQAQIFYDLIDQNLSLSLKEKIFRFLMMINPAVSIGSIVANNLSLVKGIDIPRVIAISLHLGMIQRVREYPIIECGQVNESNLSIKQNCVDEKPKKHKGNRQEDSKKSFVNSNQVKNRTGNEKITPDMESKKTAVRYICCPSFDELRCEQPHLSLSQKDLKDLKRGPVIFK